MDGACWPKASNGLGGNEDSWIPGCPYLPYWLGASIRLLVNTAFILLDKYNLLCVPASGCGDGRPGAASKS